MLITRASSINRALDQIGDKWCMLIIQELFWGINSFSEMARLIGASKGVLSDRLKWLESIDCLKRDVSGTRPRYQLTAKSIELFDTGMMSIAWERAFFENPELDPLDILHHGCGHVFTAEMRCQSCHDLVHADEIDYFAGSGAGHDLRKMKVRRRSSKSILDSDDSHHLYKNLVHLVGDRWTANLIALSFHQLRRFDDFHEALPVATNVLSDRLKLLVEEWIFVPVQYMEKPRRFEYHLSDKGRALFPYMLTLLQWGDRWCDIDGKGKPMVLLHKTCGQTLVGEVCCSACQQVLKAYEVSVKPLNTSSS